jgi:heat shock protein HslJ
VKYAITLLGGILAGGLPVIATSCGGESDGPSLEGTEWTLVSGIDAPHYAVPTIAFDRGDVSGFAGCNGYGGRYEIEADSIRIEEVFATTMGCPGPEMATEEAFFEAFSGVNRWSIQGDGELVLYSGVDEVLR